MKCRIPCKQGWVKRRRVKRGWKKSHRWTRKKDPFMQVISDLFNNNKISVLWFMYSKSYFFVSSRPLLSILIFLKLVEFSRTLTSTIDLFCTYALGFFCQPPVGFWQQHVLLNAETGSFSLNSQFSISF